MPIVIRCTNCARKYRVQEQLLGKPVKCPKCKTTFAAQPTEDSGPKPTAPDSAPVLAAAEPLTPPPLPAPGVAKPDVAQQADEEQPISSVFATPAAPVTAPQALPAVPIKPQPAAVTPLQVFSIIGGILVLAGMIGCGVGSIIAAAVQR